jgi:hypothetical protein
MCPYCLSCSHCIMASIGLMKFDWMLLGTGGAKNERGGLASALSVWSTTCGDPTVDGHTMHHAYPPNSKSAAMILLHVMLDGFHDRASVGQPGGVAIRQLRNAPQRARDALKIPPSRKQPLGHVLRGQRHACRILLVLARRRPCLS